MSEALKPSYYLFENVSGQFITDDIKEAENWKKYGDPMTELYTQSQLDSQSAYIEELKNGAKKNLGKLMAICASNTSASESKILAEVAELLQSIINQSPTTSLEQVKRDAIIEAANSLCVKGESVHPARYTAFIEYANNLKEKG